MRIKELRVTCCCGEVFEAEVPIECDMQVAVAAMKTTICPKCGSSDLVMGGAYDDAPAADSPLQSRLEWWLECGDCGASSLTLSGVLGRMPISYPDTPHDVSDFGRCCALLKLIPEWHPMLPLVSNRLHWWGPFTDLWDDLEALYEKIEEQPRGKGRDLLYRDLYRAMQLARVESMRLRYPGKKIETNHDGFFASMT